MSAAQLILKIHEIGAHLRADGDRLVVGGPRGNPLSPELRTAIINVKAKLLELLSFRDSLVGRGLTKDKLALAVARERARFETSDGWIEIAAPLFDLPIVTLQHAAVVVERAVPELCAAVDVGRLAVSRAADLARLPTDVILGALAGGRHAQRRALAGNGKKVVRCREPAQPTPEASDFAAHVQATLETLSLLLPKMVIPDEQRALIVRGHVRLGHAINAIEPTKRINDTTPTDAETKNG